VLDLLVGWEDEGEWILMRMNGQMVYFFGLGRSHRL
jgi:hypothetical protein